MQQTSRHEFNFDGENYYNENNKKEHKRKHLQQQLQPQWPPYEQNIQFATVNQL